MPDGSLKLDILLTALFDELSKETKKSDKISKRMVDDKIASIFNNYFSRYNRNVYVKQYDEIEDSLLS